MKRRALFGFTGSALLLAAAGAAAQPKPVARTIAGHPVHYANRQQLIAFADRQRLPNMHAFHSVVQDGALMGYGSEGLVWPQVAEWIDRIVKGAKPSDLPVVRPQAFRFTVNLKSARALGISISQAVLLRADQVIE